MSVSSVCRIPAECAQPRDASFGFDARERGGFVHKALENVWKRLASQKQLRSTPADDLRFLVREAIAEAVQYERIRPLHQLSVIAERERLEDLILEWLSHESARNEAVTVETVEQDRKYEVPGLSLQLRVDRIDRSGQRQLGADRLQEWSANPGQAARRSSTGTAIVGLCGLGGFRRRRNLLWTIETARNKSGRLLTQEAVQNANCGRKEGLGFLYRSQP